MKMTQAALRDLVKEVAGEVVAEQMKESAAKGAEAAAAARAAGGSENVLDMGAFLQVLRGGGTPANSNERELKPGDRFFRALGAIQAGQGERGNKIAAATKWAKSDPRFRSFAGMEKDLSSVIESGGAVLIREELSDDFIAYLRPAHVLGKLGARVVPMSSNQLLIPAHTIGSTGGWIGEGEAAPTTAPSFGGVEMRLRTYASVVPVPNDLIKFAFLNAEAFVGADMRLDVGSAFDLAYLRGSGSNGQPQGVRWRGRATASLGTTLDNIVGDLLGCFTRAGEANLPMQRLGWGMSWKLWQKLASLRDTGTGLWLFKDEMRNGTLLGQPFVPSGQIKNNYDPYATGTANKTELYWFDLDSVLVGNSEEVQMLASIDGAYETGAGVKSALSRNETVIRVVAQTDVQVRYRDGVQIVDGIAWIN